MNDLGLAFLNAVSLVTSFDSELSGIVLLSLRVSLSATLLAFVIGAPGVLWVHLVALDVKACRLLVADPDPF